MATGWGSKTWGASDWGDLSNETVSVSGIALTSSIGSETVSADANVSVTGSQITLTNAGATGGTSVDLTVTGISATFSVGQAVQNLGVPVTSAGELQTTIGTATVDESTLTGEGWGRDAWGSFAWGVNYSVQLSGIEMTLTGGEESAGTDFVAEVTGQELTSTQGSISLQIDQDIFVLASEDQIDASVGSVTNTADANVSVTNIPGIQFTANGNAQLSTTQKKFGDSSLLLDGTGDFVKSSNSNVIDGDFTVEFFAYASSFAQDAIIWDNRVSNSGFAIGTNTSSQVIIYADGSAVATGFSGFNNNQFNHIALVRESGVLTIYVNGTSRGTAQTYNTNYTNQPYYIGSDHTETDFFNGYVDEFRTSTVARYTGAFTPPSSAFTVDSDTGSLLHFDGANGSTIIENATDQSFPMSMSEGQVVPEPKIEVDVTGISATMTLGTFTLEQSTVEGVTGQELTGSVGQVDAVSVAEVSGIELSGSVGSVTVIGGAGIDVTGISASISVGTATTQGWNEVNTGVNNSWSDVDLAA